MAPNKQVARFGPFKDFIANGAMVGDALYLSGQVSIDSEGNVVGVGDLAGQVVKPMPTSRKSYPSSTRRWETSSMVQVAGLVMPELLIEIKCVAYL